MEAGNTGPSIRGRRDFLRHAAAFPIAGSGPVWFVVTAFMRSARSPDESGHYERARLYHYPIAPFLDGGRPSRSAVITVCGRPGHHRLHRFRTATLAADCSV